MLFILHMYMFSGISNTAFQSSFFSTQEKTETWWICKTFVQKFCSIIEAPQNYFYTMWKYISDDVLVSMTASCSSQKWPISLSDLSFVFDFCWTLCCLFDCTLTQSHACNFVLIRQFIRFHHSALTFNRADGPVLDWNTLQIRFYFIPYFDRQI